MTKEQSGSGSIWREEDFYPLHEDPHLRGMAEGDSELETRLSSLDATLARLGADPTNPAFQFVAKAAEQSLLYYMDSHDIHRYLRPE